MVSGKFRQQLRHEAQRWQTEGLIDANLYQQLAVRYQFDLLDAAARDRFIVIFIALGSILLGIGVITFVAANWQTIPRELKVLLLMSLFVTVNASGFYLWKYAPAQGDGRQRWQQRLGQGILLLGALILGANMSLMGQLFHRSGSPYELCLIWGLAVLAMAYSLRLTSLGVLAQLLMGIGYWLGIWELTRTGVLPALNLLMQYMPIIAMVLFIPLAYWCRSRVIFGLGAIAIIFSFHIILGDMARLFEDTLGLVIAIGFTLPPALLWSYDDRLWGSILRRPSSQLTRSFQPLSRGLALCYLAILLYLNSFHWVWSDDYAERMALSSLPNHLFTTGLPLLLNPNLIVLVVLTLLQWVYLFQANRSLRPGRLDPTNGVLLSFLVIMATLAFWHWSISPIQIIATYIINALLFLLASGLIREAIAQERRLWFWGGMVLITLQIISRTFEYETGLLLKSIAFLLCGVGVIIIGLWFERYVRNLNPLDSHTSS
jgi:uncharacterized membrane protein